MKKILISRTDNIGDVVLTLPLAFYLKKEFPNIELVFLCKNYTKAIVECTDVFNEIWTLEELKLKSAEEVKKSKIDAVIHVFPNKEVSSFFKKCKIPIRIGTSHRWFHWLTCNKKVDFTRKNSDLHEAQLNFKLLQALFEIKIPALSELNDLFEKFFKVNNEVLLKKESLPIHSIIIHPKSNASAVEYPIEKYIALAKKLLEKGEKIVFTGTEKEGIEFRHLIPIHPNCFDYTGRFTLSEFISFLSKQKSFISCSTGPYHIAGVLGIQSIGLFSAQKPIHPGRWKALGNNVKVIQYDSNCENCRKKKRCYCIQNIEVDEIIRNINF
ncbi:MAG: glycosyltransferase family 9 protein [Flavobacteriia bacterium]|nr:glycosyltransferase family 9 protein [Flavobacteriia bacterium]